MPSSPTLQTFPNKMNSWWQAVSPVFSVPAGPWGQGPLYFSLGHFCSPSDFKVEGSPEMWPLSLHPLDASCHLLYGKCDRPVLPFVILVEACTCIFCPDLYIPCSFHPWKTKHVYFSPHSPVFSFGWNWMAHFTKKKSLGISYLWADPGEVKGLFLFYL